ncbi:PDDEXK family nuclease [Candidatus Venteria ishoeyi]|uniref:hypothetical protein n=1 Tax=Candidatus Venteria ishoeyi TaxID=1899563 RepID=UPI0011B00691|nr:hypothetical protein [Candidatus Venteria ishoeyi]
MLSAIIHTLKIGVILQARAGIAAEYVTTNGRIDTLAVDYTGTPVIIEYKHKKDSNIITQGLSYLRWLQVQKIEFFEMLLIKSLGQEVATKIIVDWKNPRLVCIAESYNAFDIGAIEAIQQTRIELFKYQYYDKDIFTLEPLSVSKKKAKSSSVVTMKKIVKSKISNMGYAVTAKDGDGYKGMDKAGMIVVGDTVSWKEKFRYLMVLKNITATKAANVMSAPASYITKHGKVIQQEINNGEWDDR